MCTVTRELEDKRNENRPVSVRYRGYMVNPRRRYNIRRRRIQERRTQPPNSERLGAKVLTRQERLQIRPERKNTPFRMKHRKNPKKTNVLIDPAEAPNNTTTLLAGTNTTKTPPAETPSQTTAPENLSMEQLILQQRMEN